MRPISIKSLLLTVLAATVLAGCSPQYNWRDYRSPDAPFSVLFPDKPATHTRSVTLGSMTLDMTMTAAEIDGVTFAVGSAQAPDPARAAAALAMMKSALVQNIGASIKSEKAGRASTGSATAQGTALDVEATGMRRGTPMRLVGHFESRGKRFYQVIVMGPAKEVSDDQVQMFMSSFKLD
jgi:hypothetical protein